MTFEGAGWRVIALAGFTLLALAFFSFTLDDSYIALRYGRNLAAGLGPVFDRQPPREAFSSPLWILAAAAPFILHLSNDAAVMAVKVLGLAMGLLTLTLAARFAEERSGRGRTGTIAALLLACMPWIAFWSVGGLETPLYTALLLWALLAHERERRSGRSHRVSVVACVLLSLTRPEGIAAALLILLADPVIAAIRADERPAAALRRAAPALFIVGGSWMLQAIVREAYYGALLPSTFLAKSGLTLHDVKMRGIELLPLLLYAAPLVAAIAWARPRGGGLTRAAWAAAIAQAAFIVVPRLEGAPGYRYELPLLVLLAVAAAPALDGERRRGTVLASLLVFLLMPIAWLREPARFSPSAVEIALGRWMAAYAPGARLAVYDLGAVPYYSAAPWVFDTNGAGPLSPFLGGRYDVDALLQWSPSFLVLPPEDEAMHDPFAAILATPAYRRDYAPLFELAAPGGYRMTIWKRRNVRLPDEALDAAQVAGLYQRRVSRSTGGSPK